MRLIAASLFIVCLPLSARPLSFERREPDLYRARVGLVTLTVHRNSVSFGSVTLGFVDASSTARVEGIGAGSPATYWQAGTSKTCTQFPKVALRNVYPGVDAIFYGNGENLEYDILLAPGAKAGRLRLRFDGARKVEVDAGGNLRVESAEGYLLQMRPTVMQANRRISSSYVMVGKNQIGFKIGKYDARIPLTIDPELIFSKYFGGGGADNVSAIATDAQGNVYFAGTSNSVDFPTSNGTPPRASAPLASVAGGSATGVLRAVSGETTILGIGATLDGRVIYALGPNAVYVSSDQGASWTYLGPSPLPTAVNNFPLTPINKISVDSIDPSRVFIATTGGLYFSGDGGRSFGLHNFGLSVGPNNQVNVTSVVVSPTDHLIVYAATANPARVYKSVDAGGSWTPLDPAYPSRPTTNGFQNFVLALGPNGTDVYVVDPYGVLVKSTDGGVTWRELAHPGFGVQAVLVDSANPSAIYVGTTTGILKSVDGGTTFGILLPPTPLGNITQVALDSMSGTLYFGTQNAVGLVSTNGGTARAISIATPNVRSLVAAGGQIYVGFDTPSSLYVIKWDRTGTHILYSVFFGGTRQDLINTMAVDAQGNCSVGGYTLSADFPVTTKLSSGAVGANTSAAFVTKLSADGTRMVFSSLLAGSTGSVVQALAVDAAGAVYVTGQAGGSDFPVSSNALQAARPTSKCARKQSGFFIIPELGVNAFVSKISPDGSQLVYSTLVTGSCGSSGRSIAVNAGGEAVIAGYTTSTDLPVTATAYQPSFPGDPVETAPPNVLGAGFAARIGADGDRLMAGTYLGGSYSTQASGVALDSSGNVFLTGSTAKLLPGATPGAFQTASVDRCVIPIGIGPSPPYTGATDAFVLKLDPNLSTAGYMTYLGGGCSDFGTSIAVDPMSNAWVVGFTQSSDFPLKTPFAGNGSSGRFVSEFSPDGSQLLFSSGTDAAFLAIDSSGVVNLAGSGSSPTVPKRAQSFGVSGAAVEWNQINPTTVRKIAIDNIQPVAPFPQVPQLPTALGNGIAPGELIRIIGRNLGPAKSVNAEIDSIGRLPFTLGGATVLFDNVPAPIISVSDTAVICFAPFEISLSANVVIRVNGQQSNSVQVRVAVSDLQILTITNADGSINSAERPAKAGEVLIVYVSGLGQTQPASADGLTNTFPLAMPLASVTAAVPGGPARVDFVGAAPGQIAGITQINVRLPASGYPQGPLNVRLNNATAPIFVAQ